MNNNFSADFFRGNRERLRTLFAGTAPIVISANGLLQKSADTAFPFSQDRNFWYLTGINEPDLILVMDKDREYLILPERTETQDIFDGSVSPSELIKVSGVKEVFSDKEGWRILSSRLKKAKHVATLAAPPAYIKAHGMFVNPARKRLINRIKLENTDIELLDLRKHMARMRMVKQQIEITTIEKAVTITTEAFTKIKRSLPRFQHEYEIEAIATSLFRNNGVQHAYTPIVATGANACTLHYVNNDDELTEGGLVLLDIGAELQGYAADISRTYALGEPTRRQQQIWQAVADVQEYSKTLLHPGVIITEYEKKIEAFMGEKLRELGLIKTIEHDTVRQYFPHATSHFLGLDVHDVADYDRPLEVGMVLTVEPGIYITEESTGVRIEDDVLITNDGPLVLSEKLPTAL